MAAIQVKNTFITVSGDFDDVLGDFDDFDLDAIQTTARRQMTEPASYHQLQISKEFKEVSFKLESLKDNDADEVSSNSVPSAGEPEHEPRRQNSPEDDDLDTGDWTRIMTGAELSPELGTQAGYFPATLDANVGSGGAMPLMPIMMWPGMCQMPLAGGMMVGGDASDEAMPSDWSTTFTVMMRNLPNKYNQKLLLDEINNAGFQGGYDFFYLPIDTESHANRGYAFVNFTEPRFAWQFKVQFEGCRMANFNSDKYVTVTPAALQGFAANHAHYCNSRVSRGPPDARPLFLREVNKMEVNGQKNAAAAQKPAQARRRGGRRSLIDQAAQAQAKKHNEVADFMGEDHMAEVQVSFCPFCGGRCNLGFKFCQFCGASLAL